VIFPSFLFQREIREKLAGPFAWVRGSPRLGINQSGRDNRAITGQIDKSLINCGCGGRSWDGGEDERLVDGAYLGAADVGHRRGIARFVEAVVQVVAADALPDPRRLVVQPRDVLLQAGWGHRHRRGGLSSSRGGGHRCGRELQAGGLEGRDDQWSSAA